MKSMTAVAVILACLFLSSIPLLAHHAFSSEYDVRKPTHLTGKVSKVEWGNPHVVVHMEVPINSKLERWDVELNPPDWLIQNGWKMDTLKSGTEICVEGFLAKNGIHKIGSNAVTLRSTGKVLQTPAGAWMERGKVAKPDILYTGTPCSGSGRR